MKTSDERRGSTSCPPEKGGQRARPDRRRADSADVVGHHARGRMEPPVQIAEIRLQTIAPSQCLLASEPEVWPMRAILMRRRSRHDTYSGLAAFGSSAHR